jgi:hypothetical protein
VTTPARVCLPIARRGAALVTNRRPISASRRGMRGLPRAAARGGPSHPLKAIRHLRVVLVHGTFDNVTRGAAGDIDQDARHAGMTFVKLRRAETDRFGAPLLVGVSRN